ncbi:hypothetical protein JCM17380_47110 [Desulfosporosinus burensis]
MFMSDMLLDEAGFESANAGRVKSNKENRVKTIRDIFFFMKYTPEIYSGLGYMQKLCQDARFEVRGAKFELGT